MTNYETPLVRLCPFPRFHPPHKTMSARMMVQCPGLADVDVVTALAALIREVDGNHDLGAGALAEALVARGVTL